jgi:hypothetical protein
MNRDEAISLNETINSKLSDGGIYGLQEELKVQFIIQAINVGRSTEFYVLTVTIMDMVHRCYNTYKEALDVVIFYAHMYNDYPHERYFHESDGTVVLIDTEGENKDA